MMCTRSLYAGERAALIATCASAWMFAVASSHASLAANFRAFPMSSADEMDSRRMLRDVRNAELTGDLATLTSLRDVASATTSNDADIHAARALLLERIALAERAIAMRGRAQSARELAQGEEALATERLALTTRFATADRRQLELESAEDLLLRRMRADLLDVALALGVPTDEEREAARRLSKLIVPIFTNSRAEDSTLDASRIATDPEIFREAMLGGIASLLAADVAATSNDPESAAAARRARDRAVKLLAIAARSELPVPPALADALAIARVRATISIDSASNPAAETRAITQALEGLRRSTDQTNALVGRFLENDLSSTTTDRAANLLRALALGNDLALDCIAACATADRLARVGNAALIEQPIAALFARAIETPNSERSAALTTLAAAIRARLTPAVIAAARSDSKAPPLLAALSALCLTREGAAVTFESKEIEQLDRAVADPRVASWFAIPYAAALVRAEAAYAPRAADHLLTLVATAAPDERTRAALAIALDQRREEAQISATGEAKLASALELAAKTFPSDDARDSWFLEAVDLALFPKFGPANLESAAQLLARVKSETTARTLRSLELAHESGAFKQDRSAHRAAVKSLAREIAESLADSSLRPRSSALLTATQFDEGDFVQAMASASRTINEAPTSRAAFRAALTWIAAALKFDGMIALPPELATTMRAFPELQRVSRDAIDERFVAIETAVVRAALVEAAVENVAGTEAAAADADARRIEVLAEALRKSATEVPATLGAKHALALLATGA
ncbi:MAG: hypothetical protein RIR10_1806, partial [Planctomycetota bacterium]